MSLSLRNFPIKLCRGGSYAPRQILYSSLSRPSLQNANNPITFRKVAFTLHRSTKPTISWSYITGGIGLGLAISSFGTDIHYDSPASSISAPIQPSQKLPGDAKSFPSPPESSVNLYKLSFGTVIGVCTGVFAKKGAKAVAFFVGGIFVLLQYLYSLSVVRVDWDRAANKFENLFYTIQTNGVKRPPTVFSLWKWLIDFLTTDFQPRASFIAGFILGIRIG